ncbi:DNA polymerase delta catalytic subunit, putative [Eimeria necatrix]|uniref:DNA polymerase n=1 Tax=Eimeria necatrix TaxID=51315 RepID=U6N1G2_9EIME|nr:DNA polymerase delta catalytic subunit, putative [Eimeria necatrix]CDJ70333.1 DNA polymerase delta catalytic subunit, putative [Eimeria necatrix]
MLVVCGLMFAAGDEDRIFFQLDVAAATAFQHSSPDSVLKRPLQLQQQGQLAASGGRNPPIVTPSSLAAAEAAKGNSMAPMVRLYGVTASGLSVMCNVHGFYPYCYCECPAALAAAMRQAASAGSGSWQQNAVTEALRSVVDDYVLKSHAQGKTYDKRILDVRCEEKESLMYYSPSKAGQLFFRITAASPQMISGIRGFIESGIWLRIPDGFGKLSGQQVALPETAYEANIPFVLRYMVDSDITGCCWIRVKKGRYSIRPASLRESRCQEEFDVHYADIEALPLRGEWQSLPPLRMLSFDIECVKNNGQGFPEAQEDPVIQISSIVEEQRAGRSHNKAASDGSDETLCRVIFTLHECAPIAGALVVWFDDESEMLKKWAEFVREVDPDFLTGYNCINFDLCYLLTRAAALKAEGVASLSRLKSMESRISDTRFSSRALGTHDNKEIPVEGRVQFDLLELIRRDHKLKSYSLNYVSSEFLKEQKEDVHYSMIGDLFRGSPTTRRRIAVYCLKDALLPLRLLNKLLFLFNYVEMSRVTGTPLTYLLTRGQQIKVTAQLLRKCRQLQYVVPSVKRVGGDRDDKYEGATVLEPVKGFYDAPIATLDFASLYPSIMMAHNICYSTLVKGNDINAVDPANLTTTTSNPRHTFVKAGVRRGVLPMIVEELIAARKVAKKEMSEAEDKFTKSVLNGRQLALKITANSVYGYTGATVGGQLPCLEVATSITCFGRDMIEYTKRRVEELYTRENGYANNAAVVYGDTDSVMVRFGTSSIEDAMKLGREAAERISSEFIRPIKLEFEKVYCPFLLMNKKRYAGLLYTNPTKFDKIDSKGIETVRRDFSMLVQIMVDTVLKKMLIERDVENAKAYTRTKISELLQNKIDMSLLVQTKSLGKLDYDTKLPHVELAKKLRKRDPGTAPNVGDRVSYVVIQGSKGQAQYERAEDPLYVLEHNLPIDTQHYLETLKGPLMRIFEGVMSNPESLFSGGHTLKKTVMVSTQGALSKFIKRGIQCVGCRATIPEGALCKHCQSKEGTIAAAKALEMQALEKEHSALWTECQRCQGSLLQDVICVNRDCPIFYRRAKVKKEIAALEETLERLHATNDW